jgi:dTDP-4-amino-4,6-dideoxygalactose transaminase
MKKDKLAIDGGEPVRTTPWPARLIIGKQEKGAVSELIDEAARTGEPIGYNGPSEQAFCNEFAMFMGGGYADAVNSGTSALYCALRALEIEPFTEIVAPAVTDPGGIMPIPLMNCIPVIADTTRESYNTGPEEVERVLTPLTSAIVVAHIAGEPCDIEAIAEIARKRNIPLVEDCAQAHLARYRGRLVGTFGDVAIFSMMFGKHFCTGGQGGMVFTGDETLYQRTRWASDRGKPFGLNEDATNQIASLNLNLNDLAATIGRVQLRKLPSIVRSRRRIAAAMTEGLKGLKTVRVGEPLPGAEPSYWFLRVRFDPEASSVDKETYLSAAEAEGLTCIIWDYTVYSPHRQEWFAGRRVFGTSGYPWTSPDYTGDPNREFPCPNAQYVGATNFNIHFHERWGDREIADAVGILRKVDAAYRK